MGSRLRRLGGPPELLLLTMLSSAVLVALFERLRLARMPRDPLGDEFAVRAGSGTDLSLAQAATGDVLIILGLLLIGGLLVPQDLPLGTIRIPVALLTGVGLQATLALLLLSWPISVLVLVAVVAVAVPLLRSRGVVTGWRRRDILPLATAGALIAATAVMTRSAGWAVFTSDSWSYWRGAEQLAAGTLGPADLQVKRMLALQGIHAPGFGIGIDGVITLGPVLLLTAIALLALAPWQLRPRPSVAVLGAAAAAALFVAVSQWFWWVALYINSHLLVGVMLLMVVIVILLAADTATALGGSTLAVVPVALALSTVALARTEGVVVAALVLLGTLSHAERWQDLRAAWYVLGGVTIAWNGLLILGSADLPELPLTPVLGVIAGTALLTGPFLVGLIPRPLLPSVPVVVVGALWAATVVILLTPIGQRVTFAEMVRLNLGQGLGSWYLAGPLIALMGVTGLVMSSGSLPLAPARWLVIGFIPVTLFSRLAAGFHRLSAGMADEAVQTLLSGGGRTSAGDSVTRMWTHIALVAIGLLILGVAGRSRQRGPSSEPPSPKTEGAAQLGAWTASLGAVLMLALVMVWWRPGYLGPDGPVTTVTLATADTDRFGPELSSGVSMEQTIDVPQGLEVPSDVRYLRMCTDVAFTVSEGQANGDFRIRLRTGDATTTAWNRGEATEPDTLKTVCSEPGLPLPSNISVDLLGRGGSSGSSVIPIVDASGDFVREASVLFDAPSIDPRSTVVRFVSSTMRRIIQAGPSLFGLACVLLVALDRRPRRPVAP